MWLIPMEALYLSDTPVDSQGGYEIFEKYSSNPKSLSLYIYLLTVKGLGGGGGCHLITPKRVEIFQRNFSFS